MIGILLASDDRPAAATVAREADAFQAMLAKEYPAPKSAGDGIVSVAIGPRYQLMAEIQERLLRESGCTLPLYVCREPTHHPYALKTQAIIESGFSRVLFLDADAYCVADPTPLFSILDEAPFAYWPDLTQNPSIDFSCVGTPRSHPTKKIQGGHYMVDCRAAWKALNIADACNRRGQEVWWRLWPCHDEGVWAVVLAHTETAWTEIQDARWQPQAFTCGWRGTQYIVHRCQGKLFPDCIPRWNLNLPKERRVQEMFRELNGDNYRNAAFGPCPSQSVRSNRWRIEAKRRQKRQLQRR